MTVTLTLQLSDEQLDELLGGERPAGVQGLPDGFETTMAGLSGAPCELRLTRGDRSGHGWVGRDQAALVVPAGGVFRLHTVPTDFVPDALARLNDLGPRPGVEPAAPVRFDAGALAQAVASGSHELTGSVREHWRVDALWATPGGEPGGRYVEVLDASTGLWLVAPLNGQVELVQVRPAEVFRLLCALLPRAGELGEPPG
jgi:hypothetical protein